MPHDVSQGTQINEFRLGHTLDCLFLCLDSFFLSAFKFNSGSFLLPKEETNLTPDAALKGLYQYGAHLPVLSNPQQILCCLYEEPALGKA